ncbi:MAG: DUF5615 family PIN-like protein [Salinibacter sp.]
MKFFADHCVPRSVIDALRETGHRVIPLREELPTNTADRLVLDQAQGLDAVLLSLNGDFADLVRFPPSRYAGIVALQVRNRPEAIPAIVDRLIGYLDEHPEQEHYAGTLLLVEPHRIRVRR